MALPPLEPLPEPIDQKKLRREIVIFLIFIGITYGAAGYLALTALKNPNPIWGVERNVAFGGGPLALGVLMFITGILFALSPKKFIAFAGVLWGALFAIYYSALMITATGEFPQSLMTYVIIAIPVVLFMRLSKMKEV